MALGNKIHAGKIANTLLIKKVIPFVNKYIAMNTDYKQKLREMQIWS